MICETCRPLLSEYADGWLDPKRRRQVEAHLTRCTACTTLVGDFRTMGGLLRGLPLAQTSPSFDAQLAARLAQTKHSSVQASWLSQLAEWLRPASAVWRPALAFSAAAAAVAGVLVFQHPTVVVTPQTPAVEGALVAQCVQQHRSYVGAQPLSDPAAQSLANRLDETSPVLPAPTPGENDL